jgi:hypothetical protein
VAAGGGCSGDLAGRDAAGVEAPRAAEQHIGSPTGRAAVALVAPSQPVDAAVETDATST